MSTFNNSFGAFRGFTSILAFLVLAACTGRDGTPGTAGTSAVTRTSKEPPSGNCVNGGSRVDFGQDKNGDGKLEDPEVAGSVVICDGASGPIGGNGTNGEAGVAGPTALVEGTTLPVGDAHCPDGGLEIKTGVDKNNNGVLDAGEFVATFSCNGAATRGDAGPAGPMGTMGPQGDAGAPGLNSLIKLTIEAAGPHCGGGGVKVDAGLDSNRNGVLDPGEVTSTQYVCSASPFCLDVTNTAGVDLTDANWFDACVAATGTNVELIAYDAANAVIYTGKGVKTGVPWTQNNITDTGSSPYDGVDHDQKIVFTNGDWFTVVGKSASFVACRGSLAAGYGISVFAAPPTALPSNIRLGLYSYNNLTSASPRTFFNWGQNYEMVWNGGAVMDSCTVGTGGFVPQLGRLTVRVY